jgi:hypothetical protein
MGGDYRVYDRYLYSGCNLDVSSFKQGKPGLSSEQLVRLSVLIAQLDFAKVRFTGTMQFDGHSFTVGYDVTARAHFISLQ